jgi:uncharacterized protein (UPF0332 family)
VSRAYYGAFHLTKAFLRDLGFETTGHGEPVQFLSMGGNSDARIAALMLSDLRNARVKADYVLELVRANGVGFGRQQVEAAHRFVTALDQSRRDEVRDAMKVAIGAYVQQRGGSA